MAVRYGGFPARSFFRGDLSSSLISSMSAIGVTPAIGSLENSPMRYASAPDEFAVNVNGAAAHAGNYAGVFGLLVHARRTRITSPLGPFMLRRTPRTSTSIGSGFTP